MTVATLAPSPAPTSRTDLRDIPLRALGPVAAVAPLRDAQWTQDAALAITLRQELDTRLAAGHSCGMSPDAIALLPGLALASAVLRGALWRPSAWPALAGLVAAGSLRVQVAERFPGLGHVDLVLRLAATSQDSTNLEPGAALLRWFPDVLSLHLLARWSRIAGPVAAFSDESAALRSMLAALGQDHLAGRITPERLGRAAVAAMEACSGVAPATLLVTAATGENLSLSATAPAWTALCTGPRAIDTFRLWQAREQPAASPAPPNVRAARMPDASHPALVVLKDLLAMHAATSSRGGTRPLRAGIDALVCSGAADDMPILAALLDWYRALLDAGNKPRTIRDYHSIAGRPLLMAFGAESPWEMASDEMGARLAQALDFSRYSNRGHPAGRIAHLARHATRYLGWPAADLADLLPEDERARPSMVATAVLPWTSYETIWSLLRKAPDQPRAVAEMEARAFALMAWGGLRAGEVTGRMLADLAQDLTVHVHCTPGHGIKSDAARRQVPLGLFLPDEVAEDLRAYRARQLAAFPDPTRVPLFEPQGLLVEDRLDPARLRQRLQRITQGLFGVPFGLHALRHAWASVVELLLVLGPAEADLLTALTGWDEARQGVVRRRLLSPYLNRSRLPGVLAGLIGHRELSPVTALSYCHLADLGLGRLILGAPERHPPEIAGRMLGLNIRTVGDHVDADGMVRLEALRGIVLARHRPEQLRLERSISGRQRTAAKTPALSVPDPATEEEARTPEMVRAILISTQEGRSPAELALAFAQPLAMIRRINSEARRLMARTTAKGTPRARHPARDMLLLPLARLGSNDKAALLALLRRASSLPSACAVAWARPLLEQTDRHRSRLLFRHPRELRCWLDSFPGAVSLEMVHIEVLAPQVELRECLEAWQKAIGPGPAYAGRDTGADRRSTVFGRVAVTFRKPARMKQFCSFSCLRQAALVLMVVERIKGAG